MIACRSVSCLFSIARADDRCGRFALTSLNAFVPVAHPLHAVFCLSPYHSLVFETHVTLSITVRCWFQRLRPFVEARDAVRDDRWIAACTCHFSGIFQILTFMVRCRCGAPVLLVGRRWRNTSRSGVILKRASSLRGYFRNAWPYVPPCFGAVDRVCRPACVFHFEHFSFAGGFPRTHGSVECNWVWGD